jgi:hypothetical protein
LKNQFPAFPRFQPEKCAQLTRKDWEFHHEQQKIHANSTMNESNFTVTVDFTMEKEHLFITKWDLTIETRAFRLHSL